MEILASSAAVECLFSIAGKVFMPDRCLLADVIINIYNLELTILMYLTSAYLI